MSEAGKPFDQMVWQRMRDEAMAGWFPWWRPFMRRSMPRVSAMLELQRTCVHEHPTADESRRADCGLTAEDILALEDVGAARI